jgi:hypothetical protein
VAKRAKKTTRAVRSKRDYSVQDCADEIGIDVELLRDYAIRGCPHDKAAPGKPNRYDPAEVVAWMQANNLTGKPGRPSHAEDSPDLEAARLRKENALAAKYEMQVARERKELIPVAEVQRWIADHVTTAKNRLIGLGAGIVPHLQGRDAAEQQTIIDERVNEILNELAAN